jgi:hypothetical protein
LHILAGVIASTLLLAGLAVALVEAKPTSLEYRFREATVEPPDQRTLDRIRRRPSNLQCKLVEFSVEKLVELIILIDSGDIGVTDSSITLSPFGRDATFFAGFYSSTNAEDGRIGPYEWVGKLTDQSYFKASFIISRDLRLTGRIDTPVRVYSLSQSRWSGNQFLCEIDPSLLPKKVD